MTGTAMTEADEFMKIYRVEVIAIPTNKAIRRVDYNDKIYKSESDKYDALVEEIRAYSEKGYPSDPFSLADMLRQARKSLHARRHTDHAEPTDGEIVERIDAAITRPAANSLELDLELILTPWKR